MLVLTRKQNEQIRIGEDITITIVRTKGKAVRLGIQAPENVGILRGELVFDLTPTAEIPSSTGPKTVGAGSTSDANARR